MKEAEKIGVVADSGSMISPEAGEKLGIEVVPIMIYFGQEQYRDQIEITAAGVKRRFEETGIYPATSGPLIGDLVAAYQKQLNWANKILSIHIAEGISFGTHAAALTAARTVKQSLELPENAIEIFDSRQVALATGFLVREALELISKEANLQTTVSQLTAIRTRLRTIGTFENLTFARKTARIPPTILNVFQKAKDILKISPIVQIIDGGWPLNKIVLTRKEKSMYKMAEVATYQGQIEKAGIFHFDAQDLAEELAFYMEQKTGRKPPIVEAPASFAAGAGPDFVGISLLLAA